MENVDNVLFFIHFGYLKRYKSDIEKERDGLLADLFRLIKSLLLPWGRGGENIMGNKKINIAERVKEILKEEETEGEINLLERARILYPSYIRPSTMEELREIKIKMS